MKEIDLEKILVENLRKYEIDRNACKYSVFLTLPEGLSEFLWIDDSLEIIIIKIIDHVFSICLPGKPIRISLSRKKGFVDIETMLNLQPSSWILLKVEVQSLSTLHVDSQKEFVNECCEGENELVAEDSNDRLIICKYTKEMEPQIILWIRTHKSNNRYILLIPIFQNTIVAN